MTTTATNFLGIPVEGDIHRGDRRPDQKPLSELEPLIRAVLADPTIHDFGWSQYTPYFNDGDPCTFRVGEPWFRTVEDAAKHDNGDDFDEYSYEVGYDHPSIGGRKFARQPNGQYAQEPYEGPDEARYERCLALSAAIAGGAFENVLLEAFGDHARVRVGRDGITVEFYEHD